MPPSARRHRWSPAEVRVGKIQKTKRKGRGKNIARLNKKQNASKAVLKQWTAFEDGFGNLVKSCGNFSSELMKQIESKLSESVVSLASFNGDIVVSECTGIFIENSGADTTTILTSANLVRSLHDGSIDNLTFKVRLPNDRVVIGLLGSYDFKYDLAVVNIRRVRGFQEARLSSSNRVQFESNSKVVAVGRCFDSGMLSFTSGKVIGPASNEIRELILSTNKMNTALNGCPLIDSDGNFVGVILQRGNKTAFVPMNKIHEFLGYSGTTRLGAADTNDEPGSNWPSGADTNYGSGLDSWRQLYGDQNPPEGLDLDVFSLYKCEFYNSLEEASAMVLL